MAGKIPSPVCDMIERLMTRGLSPLDAISEARQFEPVHSENLIETGKTRERERAKKARKRERPVPPDQTRRVISSVSVGSQRRRKKETPPRSKRDNAPADWPEHHADLFWAMYPEGRKADKAKVYALLARMRAEGFVDEHRKRRPLPWQVLWDGLRRYAESNPGEFVKGPLPWLRAQGWRQEVHVKRGGSNGKASGDRGADPVAAAAARVFGRGGRHGPAPGAAGAAPPANGVGDEHAGKGGGGEPAFDLDLKPGPGRAVRG